MVTRDWDGVRHEPGQPLGLPPHGCSDPRGVWTWNNGHNYWDDDSMCYRACVDDGEPIEVQYGPNRPR
jgi:hypothetical protein